MDYKNLKFNTIIIAYLLRWGVFEKEQERESLQETFRPAGVVLFVILGTLIADVLQRALSGTSLREFLFHTDTFEFLSSATHDLV